jgi:hypothetical protein
MTVTDVLAMIGAFTGSAALLWDVFKWLKTGPRVRVSAIPNMVSTGEGNAYQGKNVIIEVVNTGDSKTTITHLAGYHYDSWFKPIFRFKPTTQFVVPNPIPGRLPCELSPGERWVGLIEQTPDLIDMSVNGKLYVGILHSMKRSPVMTRLMIENSTQYEPNS